MIDTTIRSALVVLALGGLTACVLPVHIVEPASQAITGRYLRSDGTPAVGARVAVTRDYKDATCARADARVMADSSGVFRLPKTFLVRRWIMVIPPFEHFGNVYWVCAGSEDAASHAAYRGYVTLFDRDTSTVMRDTLTCREWSWQGRTRVTCAGPKDRAMQSGGSWSSGSDSGFYRLIVVEEGAADRSPDAFLQWVTRAEPGGREMVREMIEVPLAARVFAIEEATLRTSGPGSACVSVRSSGRPAHWYSWDGPHVRAALELGPPGVTRTVASCRP